MSDAIADKVVLILGGAGGIGRATARELATKGARVAIADIDAARTAGVVDGIETV